ncbi:MAG: 4-hydroxy-tetrahydrodipicolinate reductase, partial [Kiritimatiellae bacterium]|nr:4-hydroxy-tetrahydrodipicolinate reductase [Kiritimatiellia bacterium]
MEPAAQAGQIRLAVSGAAGRMGTTVVRCLRFFGDMTLAAALEQSGHPSIGKDAGVVAGVGALGVLIGCDLAQIAAADVLIDFSFHTAVPDLLDAAVRFQKRVVLGTTGLSENESKAVQDAARSTAVLWAPNMSLGVNLLFNLVQQAARVLGPDYDVEIVEIHHRNKKDAP